ncbi:XRE family transcriptional regulator [Halioglobus maricola]|uniref:XRE family transcriptional regulator n=1 Tax=Halioglobus maricola TaxID=2601894 RepID=A0A5P9NIJ7_9GAMM|nr:XRE family transcriptional regulator [Halioglobus maricola]
MISLRLKAVMAAYSEQSNERMTYERLAQRTGLSKATLESLGTRNAYNTSLKTVDKICKALQCTPEELLEYKNDQ